MGRKLNPDLKRFYAHLKKTVKRLPEDGVKYVSLKMSHSCQKNEFNTLNNSTTFVHTFSFV